MTTKEPILCVHCKEGNNIEHTLEGVCDCYDEDESETCYDSYCVCQSCPCSFMGPKYYGGCGIPYCTCY